MRRSATMLPNWLKSLSQKKYNPADDTQEEKKILWYDVPPHRFSIDESSRVCQISIPEIVINSIWEPENQELSKKTMTPVLDQIEALLNEPEPLTVDELGTLLHIQYNLTPELKHRMGKMVAKLAERPEYRKVLATKEILMMRNELHK